MAPSALKPPPSAPSTSARALTARSNPSSTTTSTGEPRKSAPRTERRSCTQISVDRATTIRRNSLAETSDLRPALRAWPCHAGQARKAGRRSDVSARLFLLIVVARSTDICVQDRRSVRGALLRGSPVEVVVEDGFDRAVSARAIDIGALGGGFKALGAIRTGQPDDPQTGAKALFRMRTLFEDQFTQRRSRRADQLGVGADALNRPPGISTMAGRHMFGDGRVLVIAAHAHVHGDPLALEEDLDRPRGQPRVDLGAGEAMGDAVIMGGNLDVIIDADATGTPFRELVRLSRQHLQRRAIDLFQQLPARHAEPPDRTLFVEMRHQIGNRRVDIR